MFLHGIKIFLYNIITLGEFSQAVSFLYSYSKNNRNKRGLDEHSSKSVEARAGLGVRL